MAIDLSKFVARFVEESRDHIGRQGDGIAALESGTANAEGINALFRSAHTIKGSSRMMKLVPITEIAHRLEDVLGALRDGSRGFDAALGQLLFRGVDAMAALVDKLAENPDAAGLPAADKQLCEALAAAARNETAAALTPDAAPVSETAQAATSATPAREPASAPETNQGATHAGEEASAAQAASAAEVKLKAVDTVRVRLGKLDELIKLMGEVVSSHARMRQRLLDVREIEHAMAEAGVDEAARQHLHRFARTLKDDVQAQEALMNELHDKALIMRMLPLAIVFEPAQRMIRDLARSVGKQVEVAVSGAEIELDRQLIDRLADPIIHLLRNAVDHGLETPERRLAAGKPAQGRLTLSARQDGGWVVVEVSDDGGGIPVEAVREKALRKGLVGAEKAAALSDREVVDFIFEPGFSTSAIITDLSGRGVGMDVVKKCVVDDLQGAVSVDTRPGAGTTLALRLPLSLAVMRVLLVDVAGLPFGFIAQHVAELVRVPVDELLNVAERNAVIIRNEFGPVVPLIDLLRVPSALARPRPEHLVKQRGMLLLVVQAHNEKFALQVDDLLDERDMVIKPLPEHMRKLAMVSGVVVTGRNELVGVLHVPALLDLARKARRRDAAVTEDAAPGAGRYEVLVVDDSLNTREIEKDVLEAHGYRVTLAEDGLDGLGKALAGKFDAVLTDVEMPNMDGFSLTARLRAEEKYRDTPIVIITSREKEEDKRRGVEVGADAYIVKGDFDQSSLVDTLRALLG